jgi:hypothetical protein
MMRLSSLTVQAVLRVVEAQDDREDLRELAEQRRHRALFRRLRLAIARGRLPLRLPVERPEAARSRGAAWVSVAGVGVS